jgi:hypothetical protein
VDNWYSANLSASQVRDRPYYICNKASACNRQEPHRPRKRRFNAHTCRKPPRPFAGGSAPTDEARQEQIDLIDIKELCRLLGGSTASSSEHRLPADPGRQAAASQQEVATLGKGPGGRRHQGVDQRGREMTETVITERPSLPSASCEKAMMVSGTPTSIDDERLICTAPTRQAATDDLLKASSAGARAGAVAMAGGE